MIHLTGTGVQVVRVNDEVGGKPAPAMRATYRPAAARRLDVTPQRRSCPSAPRGIELCRPTTQWVFAARGALSATGDTQVPAAYCAFGWIPMTAWRRRRMWPGRWDDRHAANSR